jgi:hypothetical protein
MPRTDRPPGPTLVTPAEQLRAARAEAAALRRRVASLEAEVEGMLAGLCYAALHDGRGGRVGLPFLWRSCLDETADDHAVPAAGADSFTAAPRSAA